MVDLSRDTWAISAGRPMLVVTERQGSSAASWKATPRRCDMRSSCGLLPPTSTEPERGLLQVGQDAQQRRLAASRRAEQGGEGTGLGLHADVVERLQARAADLEDLVHLVHDDVDAAGAAGRLVARRQCRSLACLAEQAHALSSEMPCNASSELAVGEVPVRHLVLDLGALGKEVDEPTAHELAAAGMDVESHIGDLGPDALVV